MNAPVVPVVEEGGRQGYNAPVVHVVDEGGKEGYMMVLSLIVLMS